MCCLAITVIYAQPINNHTKNLHVSSPNAAAFNKYVDIPVSHYTGVPNISIPIHTIKEGPLELPISLSFHAGGIRVDDVSSWIGMGWSLNTGGSLSRTVQGIEDEHGDGYFTTGGYQITDDPSYMLAASKGYYDYEPDIFTFTAGNYSGKFIFDKNKVIKMFPFQNVKIIPDASLNIIKIITPEGLIYTFGTKEYNYTDIESSFPNRWMLDKIESADNKYSISFNYQQESFNQEIRGSRFRTYGFVDFTYWQSGQGGGNSSNLSLIHI